MRLEEAERLAGLWGAGKLIGGDGKNVSVTLLDEIHRLRLSAVAAERERCSDICQDHLRSKVSYKKYEDNHFDGWQDACNEIEISIRNP